MDISLKLLPPSPVTDKISVDIRASSALVNGKRFVFFIEHQEKGEKLGEVVCEQNCCSLFQLKTAGLTGLNRIVCQLLDDHDEIIASMVTELEVVPSLHRSSGLIDGAWCGLYHWSEKEGRLWNQDLKRFKENDWRVLVRSMHEAGMNVIILQELFRNQEYQGAHRIESDGYRGRAFYPSRLFPERMDIDCPDVVEVILSEADRWGMSVLPGVGMYAWFDFSAGSLKWHLAVMRELYELYGHHQSLYGWYISEEVFGNLNYGVDGVDTEKEIISFFREIRKFRDQLDPSMPVMLAPNCFYITKTLESWNQLASELDIICPFAFHRMEPEDIPCEEAIKLFQKIVDDNGAHLWLDMEVFNFTDDLALYPRAIGDIVQELATFGSFEKILCYQFPGLFNAPEAAIRPGGDDTVKLYRDYLEYYHKKQSVPAAKIKIQTAGGTNEKQIVKVSN